MKQYDVFYTNKVESSAIKRFDTLEDAIAYCKRQIEGCEESTGDDNDLCGYFRYEVYCTDGFNEEMGYAEVEPDYITDYYWEEGR